MKVEVIIPTISGREKYLYWALKSCMASDKNSSVLVSINGGGSQVREVVNSFESDRIRLVQTDTFLPMSAHWEFACGHAVGDIVTIIGDDDAIVPGAVGKVLGLFDQYPRAECLTHYPASYYWPDYPIDYSANKYLVRECSGDVQEADPKEALKNVSEMKEFYSRLPYLYHGFVRLDTLNRIRQSEKLLFKRLAPDIYSDFLLAAKIDSFIRADYCFTVGGQGARSNGVNCMLNTDIGKRFYKDLSDDLNPELSGKSVNLQVLEYARRFASVLPKDEPLSPDWKLFVIRTLVEAAKVPEYRQEVCEDLRKVLDEEVPVFQKYLYQPLIGLVEIDGVSRLVTKLSDWRQRSRMRRWKDARSIGAKNVFDVAVTLAFHE